MEMLPREWNYADYKEVHKARMILSFTDEELKRYQIHKEGDNLKWSSDGAGYVIDLPLSEWVTTTIQEKLRELNNKKKLTDNHVILYEKFIVEYDQV